LDRSLTTPVVSVRFCNSMKRNALYADFVMIHYKDKA